jgi:small-conductance mechanosensitive channel
MRITDQYFWNLIFLVFFIVLVFLATVILESAARMSYASLTLVDFALITLASWRIVRAVVYDKIFAFFREQFYDALEYKGTVTLTKPEGGPRRTLADLLSCPWCFGVWAAAMVTFFYLLTPYAIFPVLFLALSAVASFLQVLSNLVGWKAEQLKNDVERL